MSACKFCLGTDKLRPVSRGAGMACVLCRHDIAPEWYDEPRPRIIRVLRWFDWASAEDIVDALGIQNGTSEYVSVAAVLYRMARDGTLTTRPIKRGRVRRGTGLGRYEYRLCERLRGHRVLLEEAFV